MLKIWHNPENNNPINSLWVDLQGSVLSITVGERKLDDETGEAVGEPIIGSPKSVTLKPYSSYLLIKSEGLADKVNGVIQYTDCRFVEVPKLTMSSRSKYFEAEGLFLHGKNLVQIDTGIIAEDLREIAIRINCAPISSVDISADMQYELAEYGKNIIPFPRLELWDRYALVLDGVEYMADQDGNTIGNPISTVRFDGEYIDIGIQKYEADFSEQRNEDYDNEEVFIEVTSGFANTTRVKLINGVGSFRWYPFGYRGEFKIKLGRKFYPGWCEYSLTKE